MEELFGVVLKDGKHICVSCAEKMFGTERACDRRGNAVNIVNYDAVEAADATPVFEHDDWRHEVAGPCSQPDCGNELGE